MARILIVDDVGDSRYLARTLLEHAGHTAAEADNGAAALSLAKAKAFDLILLDLALPDISGIEVVRRLGCSVPIVLHTATPLLPAIEQFMEAYRVRGFIAKPCEPETFLGLVSAYLSVSPG